MNERDLLIWAAGFFDGEGCVNIGRNVCNRENSKGKRQYISYQLSVIVCQKTKPTMEIFQKLFGGTINTQLVRGKFMVWKWRCWGPDAARTLNSLLPYLTVKRQPAEIGIRFHELQASWQKDHKRADMYTPELKAEQENLHLQLRMVNSPDDFTSEKQPDERIQ